MPEENIPHAFAMALAQNEDAANTYAMMTQEEKNDTLHKAQKAGSKRKMKKIINDLAEEQQL